MDGLFNWPYVTALVVVSALIVWAVVARASAQGVPLDVRDEKPVVGFAFKDTTALGHFGELITSAMLTREGWKQIISHIDRVHGIDGLFVKASEKGGFDVLITETKTTQSSGDLYKADQMTDAKVRSELDQWSTLSDRNYAMATAIIKAMNTPHVIKQLWEHDLDIGVTRATELDGRGMRKPKPKSFEDLAHKRFLEGLGIGVRWLDRDDRYIDRPLR
jgi:hypothetical protein